MQFLKLFLFVLFLFPSAASWSMGKAPGLENNSPLIGKTPFNEVLPNTQGEPSSVMNARQGKKAILIFWATWCPHCYEELGSINANQATFEQKGIKIILVDIGETKDDVTSYFQRRQMKLNSFVDENSDFQDPYHLQGVPTLIFIDENGIIRNVTHTLPSDYENYFSS